MLTNLKKPRLLIALEAELVKYVVGTGGLMLAIYAKRKKMKKNIKGRWELDNFDDDRIKQMFLAIWKDEANSSNEHCWVKTIIDFLEHKGFEVKEKK